MTRANPTADTEIFVMDADGSHTRQITYNLLDDEDPAWSPDGRRIVFARDFDPIRGRIAFHRSVDFVFDAWSMRADGGDQTRLTTETGALPAWSPDGRQIAFLSDRDGDEEIYTMRASGRDQVNRTDHPANDYFADWQPVEHHHGH